jgi:hypothetical protein
MYAGLNWHNQNIHPVWVVIMNLIEKDLVHKMDLSI